jgi:hypothetical protein
MNYDPGACNPSACNESRARESVAWHELSACLARSLTFDSADHDLQLHVRWPTGRSHCMKLQSWCLQSLGLFLFRMSDSLLLKCPTGIKPRTGDDGIIGKRFRSQIRLQQGKDRRYPYRQGSWRSPEKIAAQRTLPACCLRSNEQDPISPPFTIEKHVDQRPMGVTRATHEPGRDPDRAIRMDPGRRR